MQSPDKHDTSKGAAIYSPLVLKLYDAWVLGLSNSYAWRCPTRRVLLPFFEQHLGQRHLDVGVGTGYYLRHARWHATSDVVLMDLSPQSLHAAGAALPHADVHLVQHDVMQPMPDVMEGGFNAISLFYLLHCLPGTFAEKSIVFAHLKPLLAPGGEIYGATILGDEAPHNALGRKLMDVYNRKGIFGNRHDTLLGLERALSEHFVVADMRVVGTVALFRARVPRAF